MRHLEASSPGARAFLERQKAMTNPSSMIERVAPYPSDNLERLGLAIEAALPSHIVLAPSQLNRLATAAIAAMEAGVGN